MLPAHLHTRASATGAASRLTLVGTVHGDPTGFHKTLRILRQVRPGLIFIELSPYGYRFRREHGVGMIQLLDRHLIEAARRRALSFGDARTHSQIEAIRRQIRLPFEYRAASIAAGMIHSRIFLVDQSKFSRRLIAHWYELVSVENLVHLLGMDPEPPSIQAMYRNASLRIAGSLPALEAADGEEQSIWLEREVFMARKVLRIMSAFKREKAIYVGGWWHLTAGGNIPTLRDLLGVGPTRCLLVDVKQQKSTHR